MTSTRNPVARILRAATFRKRIVRLRKKYTRKIKHKEPKQ